MPLDPSPWWVTQTEAARRLGVTRRTVHAMVRRGELPLAFLGRRRVIPLAELEQYIARVRGRAS